MKNFRKHFQGLLRLMKPSDTGSLNLSEVGNPPKMTITREGFGIQMEYCYLTISKRGTLPMVNTMPRFCGSCAGCHCREKNCEKNCVKESCSCRTMHPSILL